MSSLRSHLEIVPVVGIARGLNLDTIKRVATATTTGGLRAIEVTLDTPGATDQIRHLADHCPDAIVGAGSVIDPDDVATAVAAGARFIVSPTTSPAVIDAAIAAGIEAVPGAATPTEIQVAIEAGATAVKVFPIATLGGTGFLDAILSPLRRPRLVPTGGVTVDVARDLLGHGAFAVGAGSSLFSPGDHTVDELTERVRAWVTATERPGHGA